MKKFISACALAAWLSISWTAAAWGQSIATPGALLTSCSAVTTAAACTAFAAPLVGYTLPDELSWQVSLNTGTASALTVNLEGSIQDPKSAFCVSNPTVCWQQLDQTTSTSGEFRSVVYKTFKWIRCDVTTYTVGTSANLSCYIQIKGQ